MIYLWVGNHQHSYKLDTFMIKLINVDGKPSSSPACTGVRARDISLASIVNYSTALYHFNEAVNVTLLDCTYKTLPYWDHIYT
jgi:hypothetical protein